LTIGVHTVYHEKTKKTPGGKMEEMELLSHSYHAGKLLDAQLREEEELSLNFEETEEVPKEISTPEYWEIQGKRIYPENKVVYFAWTGEKAELLLGVVRAVENTKLVLSVNGKTVNLFPGEKTVAIVE
jgi:hypothetical protein